MTYNIMVGREGKYVGASGTNDIVRWDRDPNDPGQYFFLMPIEERPMPDLGIREPGDLQAKFAPPAVSSLTDEIPKETEWQEIGCEVLPSVLVQDPAWSDRVAQVEQHPYYALRKYRRWKNVYDETFRKDIERRLETTIQIGMSEADVKEIKRVMGVVVSAKISGELSGKPEKADFGSGKKVSGELSATYQNQRTELERSSKTSEKSVKTTRGVKIGNKDGVRVVAWQEVEQYVLENSDGNGVRSWNDPRDRVVWSESSS